jgi:hypothetical protein
MRFARSSRIGEHVSGCATAGCGEWNDSAHTQQRRLNLVKQADHAGDILALIL